MKPKLTDEQLANELFNVFRDDSNFAWHEITFQEPMFKIARRARELLASDWTEPMPIVTGWEPVYPCLLSAKCGGWDSHHGPATPAQIKKLYSHWLPMPPSPVVDPFDVWWDKNWKFEGVSKSEIRSVWDAALQSKEGK